MLGLLLILALWFGIGFLFARYVLGQKDFFTLIPSSLGLGMVLQVLVLNLLLYVIRDNSVLAYWLSVGILGLVGLGAWRWKRGTLEPLELGLSSRAFAGAWVVILGLWTLVLPAVWNFEYFDQFWHHPLASVIAANGLPAPMPLNPDYCSFYHYAPDLLGGVIFNLSNTSFTTAFDWMDTWAVFAVLGLAANFAWRISQRRSIGVGLLGMVLFFLGGHAGWVYIPFTFEPVQELTASIAFFGHANQYAASIGEANPVSGFSHGNFFNPYSLTLHTHSMNLAWICFLLTLICLWDISAAKRGSWASWLLIGLVLGVMPLAFETLWPVPMGIIVFYGLYLLWRDGPSRSVLLFHAGLIILPAVILGFGQGGALTDRLLCPAEALGEGLTGNRFPVGPGYYSWDGPRYVHLAEPNNWLQAGIEWGGLIFLYPFLVYYFLRQRHNPLLVTILGISILPALVLLVVDLTYIRFDSGRIATLPIMIWGLVAADWLDFHWQKAGWRRALLILLVLACIYSGAVKLYTQATAPLPPELRFDPYTMEAWMSDIDHELQDE